VFQGITSVTVDGKGRLAIPTRFRDGIADRGGNTVIVTAHQYDGCLVLYPLPDWEDIARRVAALPDASPDVRNIKRRFVGQASELDIDSAGRVLLPQMLRAFARIEKGAVMLGQGHRLELWSEEQWAANEKINATLDASALPDAVQQLSF
jgi:MraZ protein